ncbi:hypothetical protein C9C33_20260 [Salmonella enterica subsp. enterica serovar Typhimurium]|nr:hypothetical protein [Salmonella enterica subsp. enterica serovar Typhimurium]
MASQTQNKQANRLVERPMVNWAIAVVSENKIDVLMKEERLSKVCRDQHPLFYLEKYHSPYCKYLYIQELQKLYL